MIYFTCIRNYSNTNEEEKIMGKTQTEMFSYGKMGKDSVRLASCKANLGKTFEGAMAFSAMLQNTKGKALTTSGATVSKMKALGAIATGKYKGKGKVVLGKGQEGNDRIDYHVQLLDSSSDSINWSSIESVGSISGRG